MRGTVVHSLLAWVAVIGTTGGCNLSDQTGGGEFSFDLRTSFLVSSNDAQWQPSPPYGVPYIVCRGPDGMVTDCCHPQPGMTAVDCQEYPLGCDDNGVCALAFDYDVVTEINLTSDVPMLYNRRSLVVSQATLPAIDTGVTGGGTSYLRAASLYVAPQGVVSSRDAGVVFLTGIPIEPAAHVDLAEGSQAVLSAFLVDFKTPFSLIFSSHVVVESVLPPGAVATITVQGKVNARF